MKTPITYEDLIKFVLWMFAIIVFMVIATYPHRIRKELKPWVIQKTDGTYLIIYNHVPVYKIDSKPEEIEYSYEYYDD